MLGEKMKWRNFFSRVHGLSFLFLITGMFNVCGASEPHVVGPVGDGFSEQKAARSGNWHRYQIALKPGELVRVEVMQQGIDVLLEPQLNLPDYPQEWDSFNGSYGLEVWSYHSPKGEVIDLDLKMDPSGDIAGKYEMLVCIYSLPNQQDLLTLKAEITYMQGNLARKSRDFELAKEHYLSAIQLFSEVGNNRRFGDASLSAGRMAMLLADASSALSFHCQALAAFQRIKYEEGISRAFNNIGTTFMRQEQFDQARIPLEKAAAGFQKLNQPQREARSRQNLGLVFTRLWEPQLAALHLRYALRIAENHNDSGLRMVVHNNLGLLQEALGRPNLALSHFQLSNELAKVHPDKAIFLSNLARCYFNLGQFETAMKVYQKALERAEGDGKSLVYGRVLLNRSFLHSAMMQPDKAMEDSSTAKAAFLQIEKTGETNVADELALTYLRLALLQREANEKSPVLQETSWSLLKKARAFAAKGLKARSQIPFSAGEARLAYQRGDVKDALMHMEMALDLAEQQRQHIQDLLPRVWYFSTFNAYLAFGIKLQLELYQSTGDQKALRQAFALSERGVGRLLADKYGDQAPAKSSVLTRIQQALNSNEVLLKYFFSNDRGFLFLVTRAELIVVELKGAEALQPLVTSFLSWLNQKPKLLLPRSLPDEAYQLWHFLVAPIYHKLSGETIYLIPGGPLHQIPMGVLPTPKDVDPSNADLRYMIEKFQISIVPFAAGLASKDEEISNPEKDFSLAVFSAPELGAANKRFPELAETRRVAQGVIEVWRDFKGSIFDAHGTDAVIGAAKDSNLAAYDFIYFITHGTVSETGDQSPGILLGEKHESGQFQESALTLEDAFQMNLDAQNVFLNACDTADGQLARGEGLLSLAKGFLFAGSKTVVAPLWKIEIEFSSYVSQIYYQEILKSRKGLSESLRAAQLTALRQPQWKDPYFWGSLQLYKLK
jgi:CHAT domain-containing protein/Tfp pilus assembly protein PilF